jgi:hypothetical protein
MRLLDDANLNFSLLGAVVFLDVEKALDTTWHPSLGK